MSENKDPLPKKREVIPIERLYELRKKNLSTAEIAKIVGCSSANVARRLRAIAATADFSANRADVLAFQQKRMLDNITDEKLKKAPVDRLVWSFGALYDKERLEAGKSSINVSYADLLRLRESLVEEISQSDNISAAVLLPKQEDDAD